MFRQWQQARRIREIRRTPIRRVPRGGEVKLVGRVAEANDSIVSPLGGVTCVLCEVELVEWENGVAYPLLHRVSPSGFALEDDSGTAWLRAERAVFLMRSPDREHTGHSSDHFRAVSAYIADHGLPMRDSFGLPRSIRWRERVLLPGDRVAVLGDITWEVDAARTALYRQTPQRITIGPTRTEPLVITDEPAAME